MTKRTGTKIKLLRGEKIMYTLLFFVLLCTPVLIVSSKASLSETNIKVEKLKSKIEKQKNINESLSMQINELASLDKIQDVAKEMGLSYNKDNIKEIANYNE